MACVVRRVWRRQAGTILPRRHRSPIGDGRRPSDRDRALHLISLTWVIAQRGRRVATASERDPRRTRAQYKAHTDFRMRLHYEVSDRLAREALLLLDAPVADPVAEIPDEDVQPLVTQLVDDLVTGAGAPARPLVGLVAA